MNSPIAAVRSSVDDARKLAKEYGAAIGDAEVTPDDHRQIAGELEHALDVADRAAERAASFVRGIKAQTRDLANEERRPFDPVPAVEDALLLLDHLFKRTKCECHFEKPWGPRSLVGSPGRLGQVVTNLVVNAVDAMKARGGGPLLVRLTDEPRAYCLEVRDAGSGIDPEVLPRIFEPLFTTKPFGEGTGMGLALVHDIVTGHFGGTIEVRSEPGRGTTFTVRFPRPPES
jgi:signal transduction histidine kinase